MLTAEDKALREFKIGSADAPIVAGLSKRKSPPELWYQILGTLPRYDEEETLNQKFGSRLQPVIAEIGAEHLGLTLKPASGIVHGKYPFMVAHTDSIIVDPVRGEGDCEVKNRAGEEPWETLDEEVETQVVHQMACSGRSFAIVIVLFGFAQLRTYLVERNPVAEDALIAIETDFYERLQRREPPPPVWGEATTRLMKALYPKDSGKMIQLPESTQAICRDLMAVKMQITAANLWKGNLQSKLQALLQDASGGTVGDYIVTWKRTQDGKQFDEARFAKEHPDLYKQYEIPKPGHRRFLIAQRKEATMKGRRTL